MKNRHQLFTDIATLVAGQSTCTRLHVGAVLVKDKRIISIGYNGVAAGQKHCEDYFKELYLKEYAQTYSSFEEFIKTKEFYDLHGKFSNDNELHAEQNALLFAAKSGITTEDTTLYITLSPCIHCAKIIAASGIKEVIFKELYDRSTEGVNFLNKIGIKCRKIDEVLNEK